MRLVATIVCAAILAQAAQATPTNVIIKAKFTEPTDRYDHAILGDAIEWGALQLTVDQCFGCADPMIRVFMIRLPETRVFEDIRPRLVDIDGDENPEVIVVETDLSQGARLAIYDEAGLMVATPYIGRSHRWLAPIGAADLDGDGRVEIAYVDRPHLARLIRVWRLENGALKLVAELAGYTNHRIGEDTIAGGIRNCGAGPELIVADANWQEIVALRLSGTTLTPRVLGPHKDRSSFKKALDCE